MKLYYTKGACSLACRIVMNEIGLPCEYISVDLKNKRTEDHQDFLKINPKGAVPTLITDNNEIITENAVIQQYLADVTHTTRLLPDVNTIERYRVLEWLNYVATELHKGFSVFFNPLLPDDVKESVFLPAIQKKLSFVDNSLGNKHYLLDDNFTLPDAYLFVMLTWSINFKFDLENWKNLARYFNQLKKRESVRKSLEEENLTF